MKIESSELEEYIRQTLSAIKKGVHAGDGFRIHGMIEFDLAVTNIKESKGGLKIYVIGAGTKHKSEKISRIRFKVHPYNEEKKN
ncbi:hypothetical protein HY504_00045 [Candidatus Wolfebacteria bacterium]|nr:hypothetical protein [Candidatus Wolfebacteria bacterium]